MDNDNSSYGYLPVATQRLVLRIEVRNKLTKLWGPESQWPVLWDDIIPSIAVWAQDGMTSDMMVNSILEVVVLLRAEGVID